MIVESSDLPPASMPILTSTSPLNVDLYGVSHPFTGLVMVSAAIGQSTGLGCNCNSGGCLVIEVENGFYQDAHWAVPGLCPNEFPTGFTPMLDPTDPGSFYRLGYKWGDPEELLADFDGNGGCCYCCELTVPDAGTIELGNFEQLAEPSGTYRRRVQEAESQVSALQGEVAGAALVLVQKDQELVALGAQLMACQSEVSALQTEVAQLGDVVASQQAEISSLSDQIPPLGDIIGAEVTQIVEGAKEGMKRRAIRTLSEDDMICAVQEQVTVPGDSDDAQTQIEVRNLVPRSILIEEEGGDCKDDCVQIKGECGPVGLPKPKIP